MIQMMVNLNMKVKKFIPKFVNRIPEHIDEGILYICIECNTVVHKCACGCGEEVVTPLDPNFWKLIYNGETVSLRPSIGNWSYKCKSHYFIINNKVEWASTRSEEEIRNNNKNNKSFWRNLRKEYRF